jgi:glycosyltransferase involved in cell wall biosynthesis
MAPAISIYIPCYNVANYVAPVIEGALRQNLPADEIVIIDDGSTDNTCEIASHYRVKIVRHERNRGLAAARNTGLQAARNEFVAFLDADCVPSPVWLETLITAFTSANVALAGGRLIEKYSTSYADRWRAAHMPQEWGDARLIDPKFMFGNNGIARKSILSLVGGYDERMRTNGEDVDMSQRLRERGYTFVYDPAATVEHLRHDSVSSVLNAYWRWWRFGVKAYAHTVRLRSIAATFYRAHLRTTLVQCVRKDLANRNFSLLFLDFLTPFYMLYRDLALYFHSASNPGASALSEAKAP